MMQRLLWAITVAGLLLVHGSVLGCEVDELHATLSQLHADAPLQGDVTIRNSRSRGSSDEPRATRAEARLSLFVDGDGLRVNYPASMLRRMSDEAGANVRDADAPTPTLDVLNSLGPASLHGMLDFAPRLLLKLEGAKLVSQRDEAFHGTQAHLLEFDIPPGLDADDRDAIKHYEGRLKVWLGEDGVPIGMVESRSYKGRKFLISFETSTKLDCMLERIGNRLVVVRQHGESKGAGFGQVSNSVSDIRLKPTTPVSSP